MGSSHADRLSLALAPALSEPTDALAMPAETAALPLTSINAGRPAAGHSLS
jgi:hypothetical protein